MRAERISDNRLLAALPRGDRRRVIAEGAQVDLACGDVLCEPGERIRHVYFPMDSFVSLVVRMKGHGTLEVGMVGDEGMLGVSLILGVNVSPLHCLVQGAGSALRMDAAPFRRELEHSRALHHALKRYLYVLHSQLAQTAACIRFHPIEARLARWLLVCHDRAHADAFPVTQESLAYMLGVRRVGVTNAACALRDRELIDYTRGQMTILRRAGLKRAACGCYEALNRTYDTVMA